MSEAVPRFTRGDWEEIGDGIRIRRVFCDGTLEALDWAHGCVDGLPNYIALDPPNRGEWKVHSTDPLTISPSLECRACGRHGHITSGKWVPC